MYKIICDRCGKEYGTFQNVYEVPLKQYSISRIIRDSYSDDPFSASNSEVHLCPECEKKFDQFLKGSALKYDNS